MFLTSLIGFLVTILIVVTIHEYGHLIMARICKVRILRFSIGFGTPLWRWVSPASKTEYVIAPIPLGGYVQLYGQSDWPEEDKVSTPSDEEVATAPPTSKEQDSSLTQESPPGEGRPYPPDSYPAKPVLARMLIASGGPLFNFILSGFLLFVLALAGYGLIRPILNPQPGSMLDAEGIGSGDVIVAIDDHPIRFRQQLFNLSLTGLIESGQIRLQIEKPSGEAREVYLTNAQDMDPVEYMEKVLLPQLNFLGPPAVVGDIDSTYPVVRSQLKVGDKITQIDNLAVADFDDMVRLVQARPNQTIMVGVQRGDEVLTYPIELSASPTDATVGVMGIKLDVENSEFLAWRQSLEVQPSVGESLVLAGYNLYDMFALSVRSIKWLISGALSLENLKGPVGIATYAGLSLDAGILAFLYFLALVSVSIGILNLLPIPVLDGGHILMLAAEGVLRKPVPAVIENSLTYLGIFLVGSMLLLTLFNDINALL